MFDAIKSIPVHMDFVGQGRAEKLYQIIIVLFGVVGLVWGYTIQQFSQTVYILGRIIQDVNPKTLEGRKVHFYLINFLLPSCGMLDMVFFCKIP